MLQKTQMSEASTNAEHKTTSFFTSKNREMFREIKKKQAKSKDKSTAQVSNNKLPNDLISFEPEVINNLCWPEICLFENDLKASVKDNFYEISGMRGKNRFLPRNSVANSELIYFWGEKPTKKINLFCIQRYMVKNKQQEELWNHINLSKYDPEANSVQSSDFYLNCQKILGKSEHQVWDFRSFQTIENCKKGVMIMKVITNKHEANNSLYRVLLIDLVDRQKLIGSGKQIAKVLATIDLDCQLNLGRENERLLKSIKSQFGDIILIITNNQIYELEIEQISDGYKLSLKPYKISKIINDTKDNYLKTEGKLKTEKDSMDAIEVVDSKTEEIYDVQFMSNGLKIMILTNYQQIIFIEAHNFLFSQKIQDILINSPIQQKYKISSFSFINIYPINGSIALEFKSSNDTNLLNQQESVEHENAQKVTRGFILLKSQNNYLAFGKIINFPFQNKQVIYRSIHDCQGLDEILIQFIEKKNPYSLNVIKCRTLMAELNSIIKLDELEYNYGKNIDFSNGMLDHLHHTQQQQKKYMSCEMPLSSRIFYFLNEKQLTCYKLLNELDAQKIGKKTSKLFSHSFFEKPIKMSVCPITLHFAIVYKEFVKFFHFNYEQIKNYYTLKMKNIIDIKYVNKGSKIMVTCIDGMIYLVDAYRFTEEKIFEFYGEPSQTQMIDEKHLLIRSNKHILTLYKKGWEEDGNKEFQKQYEIKLDEGDHYVSTLDSTLVFKRNAQMEVYSHVPLKIASDLPQAERQCFQNLQTTHKHLANKVKCTSFQNDEVATKILLNEELGFLFVSTNKGNIKQYLWPLQSATNPNPPEIFTQQVSSGKIIALYLDAKYTYLYAISEQGTIIQMQMHQFINGQLMPYVYIFSQKTKNDEQQKRQFTDRSYFIDHFTPIESLLLQSSQQNVEELQFFMDKLKDDLEEMTKAILCSGKQKESQIKVEAKSNQERFKKDLELEQNRCTLLLKQIKSKLQLNEQQADLQKNKQIEKYQATLLELYKQSDRLKKILKGQDQRLTQEKLSFQKKFCQVLQKYNIQKEEELVKLQRQYKLIEQRRILAYKQNQVLDREEQIEMKLYKVKIHEQQQGELRGEDQYKQKLLGENTKKQKAITNLRNRATYFQNLILETKVQINELKKDQIEYQNKKRYLRQQLKDKQQIIEKIQKQLVLYLKNTEDMKTIKNNHQFQLNEYEAEVNPIQDDFKRIQDNVKHMNIEIMKQYNHKVGKIDNIKLKNEHIESLKEQKKRLTLKKLQQQNKFRRLTQKLTHLAKHAFDLDLKAQIKQLINSTQTDNHLLQQDEDKQRQKKEGQRLLRYKNMVRKEIEEEEKREEHIIKNQHEFYKYHIENTTLVRQFNDLKKTQKILSDQYYKLMEKLSVAKASVVHTPLKRVPSINLRMNIEKKLTPFQKYEQSTNIRKNQDTTDTKLSRNSQSLSFLKGLMKQVNQTESKVQKMEVMRERVRTFVNPQFRNKQQDFKKILFGRTRGTSEMLKLK